MVRRAPGEGREKKSSNCTQSSPDMKHSRQETFFWLEAASLLDRVTVPEFVAGEDRKRVMDFSRVRQSLDLAATILTCLAWRRVSIDELASGANEASKMRIGALRVDMKKYSLAHVGATGNTANRVVACAQRLRIITETDVLQAKRKRKRRPVVDFERISIVPRFLADPRGVYYVLDCVKLFATPHAVEKEMLRCAKLDGIGTTIGFMQDPGSAGVAEAQSTARALDGYNVRFAPATGDKETRAKPVSVQTEAGNVHLIRGHWNENFIRVLENFPVGRHDDEADALSGAHEMLRESHGGFSYTRVETPYDEFRIASTWPRGRILV